MGAAVAVDIGVDIVVNVSRDVDVGVDDVHIGVE